MEINQPRLRIHFLLLRIQKSTGIKSFTPFSYRNPLHEVMTQSLKSLQLKAIT